MVDERYAQGHRVEASGQSRFSASHTGHTHTHRHTVQVECVLRLLEVPLGQLLHGLKSCPQPLHPRVLVLISSLARLQRWLFEKRVSNIQSPDLRRCLEKHH